MTDDYYELDLPLVCMEEKKQHNLINLFNMLDKKISSDANKYAKTWFDDNYNTYTLKTIIKDSKNYKDGIIKIKIIKTQSFETQLLLDNKKKINLDDIPNKSWAKLLLEVYSIVINTQNKSFYLFLRPIAISFNEKVKYNYKFLEDSDDENDDIPDTEINHLFLKQNQQNNTNDLTSSQFNLESNFSSSSSDKEDKPNLNNLEELNNTLENLETNQIDSITSSSSSSMTEEFKRKLNCDSDENNKLT